METTTSKLRRRTGITAASPTEDKHCAQASPEQPRSVTEKINGSIGLVLALRDMSSVCPRARGMRVWVKRVLPGSPAAGGAIQSGHELQGICGSVLQSCGEVCLHVRA